MTDAEPRADFRARVLASLPDRRRRRWSRFLVPAAAVMAVTSMAWLAGTIGRRPPAELTLARADAPGPAEPVGSLEAIGGIDAAEPIGPVGPVGPVVRIVPVVPAEDLAWRARAVPRLTPPERLAIDPIQPKQLSIAPISVEPASLDPIALGAIDSRAGGQQN